ncbi:MAG: hypothetical protein IT364_10285 [Candidatus Hydrogenedentes bacterium]|nr:hypothetical protein [Candidatus Hydrogenedentota bacterium]
MRYAWWIAASLALAVLLAGCETTESRSELPVVGASGKAGAKKGDVFLKVFVDDEAKSEAPVDIQVAVDDKPVISRSFYLGKDSDDGQYQLTLPKGTHVLSAMSQSGKAQIRRKFRVTDDDKFIELYVTDNGRVRLTRESKIRILKFVIKNYRKPQTKNFNRHMWMRLTMESSGTVRSTDEQGAVAQLQNAHYGMASTAAESRYDG